MRATVSTTHARNDGIDPQCFQFLLQHRYDLALFAAVGAAEFTSVDELHTGKLRLQALLQLREYFIAAKNIVPHPRDGFAFKGIEARREPLNPGLGLRGHSAAYCATLMSVM